MRDLTGLAQGFEWGPHGQPARARMSPYKSRLGPERAHAGYAWANMDLGPERAARSSPHEPLQIPPGARMGYAWANMGPFYGAS